VSAQVAAHRGEHEAVVLEPLAHLPAVIRRPHVPHRAAPANVHLHRVRAELRGLFNPGQDVGAEALRHDADLPWLCHTRILLSVSM